MATWLPYRQVYLNDGEIPQIVSGFLDHLATIRTSQAMMEPLTFAFDPQTRFPLVEVPGQDFALFRLPLTKVQIEYFLSDNMNSRFDRAWYRERLRANPRVTSENLAAQNLAQAFITNITFNEARVFSDWYGRGYDLTTSERMAPGPAHL